MLISEILCIFPFLPSKRVEISAPFGAPAPRWHMEWGAPKGRRMCVAPIAVGARGSGAMREKAPAGRRLYPLRPVDLVGGPSGRPSPSGAHRRCTYCGKPHMKLKCTPKVGRIKHYPLIVRVRYCTGLFPFNRDLILLLL